MIIGIGVDIIRVSRFEKKEKYFYESIFTKKEIIYLEKKLYNAQTSAGIFSAKEAFLKAIGCGIADGNGLLDIEILHNNKNVPYYSINQKIIKYINDKHKKHLEITDINASLSISHDGEYACAFAVIEAFN